MLRRDYGGWCAVKCPFHGDRQASASYNPTSQRFRCHGCGIAGDGFDLIQEVERCDFMTAKAKATEICGGSFTFPDGETASRSRSRLSQRKGLQRSKLQRRKRR
jgi:DNA primase